MEVKHWVEVIAERAIKEKTAPYTIASGMTTSGPTHLGTLCEFLFPHAIYEYLRERGYESRFIFIADILDAFDSIPVQLKEFKFLNEELGKPLCRVPDPFECCPSYGDHFLNQVKEIMRRFRVSCEVIPVNELYAKGLYDDYARLFFGRLPEVRHLIEEVSMRTLPKDWMDIVLPICEACGKIASTTVKVFEQDTIVYSCDKDVKYARGCGHYGETRIQDHQYKLFWRLDWPTRQDFLNVSMEGAGVDHHTRGGSWDTAVAIHERIFRKKPPIGFKYGFLLFRGKKYSKSKGLGLGVQELLDLVPPELLKYFLFKPDVAENKEFDPSGHKLIKLYDDFSLVASLSEKKELSRAEQKLVLAYRLAGKKKWKAEFTDVLTNYQILRDWELVAKKLGDWEGVQCLKPYIENWIEYGYVPKEFVFEYAPTRIEENEREIAMFAKELNESMSAADVHELVYSIASRSQVEPSKLFESLYRTLIGKSYGPRFGKLIVAIGIGKVKESLTKIYLKSLA